MKLFAALIVVWSVIRFLGLEQAPPGFYADEARGATHVMCLQEWGHDAAGAPYPLFADGEGGYYNPFYIYGAYLWTSVFGHSITAFRALPAFVTTLTIIGLWFLAQLLFGQTAALMTVLAATLSPWSFSISRLAADDPTLCGMAMVWGIYFMLRKKKNFDSVIAGLLFSVAMYSYAPSRALIPMLLVLIFWYRGFSKQNFKHILLAAGAALLTSLPWIMPLLSGDMVRRMNEVGIFSANFMEQNKIESYFGLIPVFIKNFFLHLSPTFLFWSGDANLRHSSQFAGELGWVDILAQITGLYFLVRSRGKKSWDKSLIFCFAGFFLAIVPSALTWEGLPHALRGAGAWPFVSLISGALLTRGLKQWAQFRKILAVVSIIFSVLFLWNYFEKYPDLSKDVWDTPVKEIALQAKNQNAWPAFIDMTKHYPYMATRYYLMYYGGMTCQSTYAK